MLPRLDAPNTMASILGWRQTYSIASRGAIAPDASTDIATGRNRRCAIVCANINKIGFRMCGGVAAYEDAIARRRFRPVAMSVFASGAIAPREAVEYVCAQPRIESIVFGASGRANIRQTRALIQELSAVGRS
jgi:hypothetical protein